MRASFATRSSSLSSSSYFVGCAAATPRLTQATDVVSEIPDAICAGVVRRAKARASPEQCSRVFSRPCKGTESERGNFTSATFDRGRGELSSALARGLSALPSSLAPRARDLANDVERALRRCDATRRGSRAERSGRAAHDWLNSAFAAMQGARSPRRPRSIARARSAPRSTSPRERRPRGSAALPGARASRASVRRPRRRVD